VVWKPLKIEIDPSCDTGETATGKGRYWFLAPYLVDIMPLIDVSKQAGLIFRRRIDWDSKALEKKSKTKRPGDAGFGAGSASGSNE
ncbi:unnamed protein product, partial [Prorocentrum cordatum]